MQTLKPYIKPEAEIINTLVGNIMLELSLYNETVDDEAANKAFFDNDDPFFNE